MSNTIRMLLLGLVGAFALSSTGTALAAYTSPRLTVSDTGAAVKIDYSQSANDDGSAKLHFFVPVGYRSTLTQSPGTNIGTVRAQGTAATLGGALLPLTGRVEVRAASGTYTSNPGAQPTPIAAAAQGCTGTQTHTAFWVLVLQAAGQTLELPVFVDAPAAPPRPGVDASQFASASIQACLPSPAVSPSNTFGFKLTQVVFQVSGVFASPSAGQPLWRLLATPYTAVGAPNPAGSVEVQSVIGFPRTVTLARPAVRPVRGIVALPIRGTVSMPAGAAVSLRLYRGARSASTPSIVLRAAAGRYAGTLRIRQTARRQIVFLQVRATAAAGTVPCTATFGVPCLAATRAAVAARSGVVRVVIPARAR